MSYEFISKLSPSILAFLKHKRELGYRYIAAERTLFELDRYCAARSLGPELSKELIEGWIISKDAAISKPYRYWVSTVREFARFLQGEGFDAHVASSRFSTRNYHPTPYFLSEAEIRSFFAACSRMYCNSQHSWRTIVLSAFFMMMHCCGLRTIEARMLLVSNTSLGQGFIDVIGSKHHRDRRIFLSDESTEYFVRYDNEVSSTFPDRTFFFPTSTDTGCDANFVNKNFNHIWDAAELRKKTGKQPQPYAFRHHFAFANINRWTDEGKNVNAMLPYLMRYMGHASLASTCYYIHLVPDFFAAYEQIAGALDDLIPEVGNG